MIDAARAAPARAAIDPLPERPTGQEMVDAIMAGARAAGVSVNAFARPMSTQPQSWLQQLSVVRRPTALTVRRVRQLLAGEPVDPPVPTNFRRLHAPKSPTGTIGAISRQPHEPDHRLPSPDRIDRDPCWRCGVRGEVGCEHRPLPPP